tara:strand:+ start:207 stop:425 length:219 start_codon:yes stop_codon:yes gene_type:complete
MKKQTLKFTIRQDGKVTEEATGFISHQCVEVTKSIEEKLGSLETRQFKPEFYSNNVALQHDQYEDQKQTTIT